MHPMDDQDDQLNTTIGDSHRYLGTPLGFHRFHPIVRLTAPDGEVSSAGTGGIGPAPALGNGEETRCEQSGFVCKV